MISAELSIIRSLVRPILEKPHGHKWQVQGLGMLRTYLDAETRLHVWDSRLNYCQDSGWHTHPWDFSSFVVAGKITNRLYFERADKDLANVRDQSLWLPFTKQHIICGPGGCAISEPEDMRLFEAARHVHYAGQTYQQHADEIHATEAGDGTVTVITRNTVHIDGSANIFFPRGSRWTSAEARPASIEEIHEGCKLALAKLDGELK